MKKTKKKTGRFPAKSKSPSQLIDARIEELDDWRGVPVWSHNGLVCTGETYKSVVKLTFFKGARMKDPRNSLTRAGFVA